MGVAVGMVLFLVLLYLIILGVGLMAYILQSLGLQTIAKRRQINNPWLAWLPFGNYWIIGSIADDYDSKNGKNYKWRKVLLTLSLVSIGAFIVVYIALLVFIFSMIAISETTGYSDELPVGAIGPFVAIYIIFIVVIMGMAALQFCSYICYFKLFESTVDNKALKYFLISLLVPFGMPVCLFLSRNKGYENQPVHYYGYPQYVASQYTAPQPEMAPAEVSSEAVSEPEAAAEEKTEE